MGARGLVVLLVASALLASFTSGAGVLEGEKPSSGEGAPAPTVAAAGGSPKTSDASEESGQSSAAGLQAESKEQQKALPPATAPKDSKVPPAEKGQEGGETQASASPPPPPLAQETNEKKASPPPGGPGPNGGGEANDGTDREDTGSQGKEDAMDTMMEAMAKCDASHKCSFGKEFSACLQVSNNASVGSFVIVQNEGHNNITINVKEAPNIDIEEKPLHLAKGAFGQMGIKHISPDGGEITLDDGNGNCVIHVRQLVNRLPVSDLQQQFQQFAAYAMRLNPIYGASFFVFTIVLVGVLCAWCKFARRRGNDGVPYQQLEMGAQAPNSSGADNTTSTTDGWEDGWGDDWDEEEAPAKPSDKKATSSVSTNGHSLRSQANSKDGWDVDWDD